MSFGSKVKEAREKLGYKQEYVCELLGTAPNYLTPVENDRKWVSKKIFIKLVQILKVNPDFFGFAAAMHLQKELDEMKLHSDLFAKFAEKLEKYLQECVV